MASGRLIKFVVFELLEFAAFSIPTLVITEQFATAYQGARARSDNTHYWLIISCSIAYVALVTLLIWVPVKVILHKKRYIYSKIKGWRPVLMMCVVLTTLPCLTFSIAVTEVWNFDFFCYKIMRFYNFFLSVFEIFPRRNQMMSGSENGHIHSTSLRHIKTVTEQVRQSQENAASPQATNSTQVSQPSGAMTRSQESVFMGPQEPSCDSGILRMMSRRDVRAELFLWSFLLWSDTIEMVRVAGHPNVYKSSWLYPVYIFSFISLLRITFSPQNPLLNSLSVLLQDLPFIFVRLGLIIALGTITPVLGLCKNILVTLSYIYFNYLTRLRIFSAFEMSPF
uniref:Transmembrane protein 236 n=1 Tax=Gorilla gorilla gorilla TaxID=9595 RepID=G3SEN4_GORGO